MDNAMKTILILGAYGGTGKPVCRWLLKTTDVAIIIAGRTFEEAVKFSEQLKKEFPSKHISAVFADACDYQSLVSAFKNVSLVIDATTAVDYVRNVVMAAMEMGADYLDFHFEQKVVADLETFRKEIEVTGRVFITQAGFHPGLPAAFVRYAAPLFDEINRAIIGMAMNVKLEKPESIYELVDVLADNNIDIFKNGEWRKATYLDFKRIRFGKRFGVKTCYPLQMEKMRKLPDIFPLDETGVYVAGFNWLVDYFILPIAIILPKIKKGFGRHFIAKLLVFGLNHFSKDNRGIEFVLEAGGVKSGAQKKFRILAEHDDAYEFTAISVIACVRQYLDGCIGPGLWMMGHSINPDRIIRDMKEMGIKFETQIKNL